MPLRVEKTPLAALLFDHIRSRGPITFAEYMEFCLYHPEFGYYSNSAFRSRADYYTNPDVHPMFGRLLARQLHEIWECLGRPEPFLLVDAGAGTGNLALQILDFAAESLGEFYPALFYAAVEACEARRETLAGMLERHIASGRAISLTSLPERIPDGCVFSNELLDALPVHRVVQERGKLCEIYVGMAGDTLCETPGLISTPEVAAYFMEQGITLAEGQQAEAGLEACRWISKVGQKMDRGVVLTIDYGHEAQELYDERHMRGTLLAYERHRASEDFFRAQGCQDLTAHVNFTALDIWGKRAGLERTGLVTQSNFLLALARKTNFLDAGCEGASQLEQIRTRLLFKTLIHPEAMGETFQVFIQHKGVEAPKLTGLEPL